MTDREVRRSPTFFLFALPSFMAGLGSVLDIFGTQAGIYNQSLTGRQADYFALKSDWLAIGEDFRKVMGEHPPEEFAPAGR